MQYIIRIFVNVIVNMCLAESNTHDVRFKCSNIKGEKWVTGKIWST